MDAHRVAVYATQDEATADGARQRGGRLVTPEGRLVITCGAPVAACEGLRVADFVVTPAAAAHRIWPKLHDVLARSVAKSQR